MASTSAGSASPVVVSQAAPSRRPTTTSGTTNTDVPAAGSKAMLANTTGPEPGTPARSSTSSPALWASHHAAASARACGPLTSSRAASPQPTRPSPRRTQDRAPAGGSRSSRAGVSSSGVVVTTGVTGPQEVTVAAVTDPA